MAEMFQFIPENERPYEWAKAEMETYFKNPERIHVTGLDSLSMKPNIHISVFHKNDNSVDIWRVYWADTDSVKYSILTNYKKLKEECPDVMNMLEKNGVAAYESEMEKRKKQKEKYGSVPHYEPLSPIKKVDEATIEYEKMKEELAYLKNSVRPEIYLKLKKARETGDLMDNPLYDEAKKEQTECEDRIRELEDKIKKIEVIE